MSIQNNSNSFNTNIEDYTISELYNLLELDEFTRENIVLKTHDLTSNIFKNNEPIKKFFIQAQNKLLNYLSNNSNNNNNLDIYLHTNANNNIEVTKTNHSFIDNISDSDTDDDDETTNNYSIINSNSNSNNNSNSNSTSNSNNNNETNNTIRESYVDYSKYKTIKTEEGAIIEKYDLYKNLYFNTFFRTDKNVALSLSTDCKIQLTNSLNNVTQCKLTAINIKKPFLIHTTKANNTFIVKKYINTTDISINTRNNTITSTIVSKVDFSYSVIIDNGYYEDFTEMEIYINNKFKNFTRTLSGQILEYKTAATLTNKDLSNSEFINALSFSINENTKHTIFDLSTSFTDSSYATNFKHYEIDFRTDYIEPYSLATILGFDFVKNPDTSNNISNKTKNYKITSPTTYCTLSNPIFFCFKENISTIIETHHLFLKNNISSDKILAKINTHKGNALNNYYIHEILDNIDNKNNIRKYNGPIHLSDFNVKIIDHFGNLVESIEEEFTFELEVIIQEMKFQQTLV